MVIVVNIDKKQFKNPSNEFRGKPFWSWNGKLEKEELLRQIDVLHEWEWAATSAIREQGLKRNTWAKSGLS